MKDFDRYAPLNRCHTLLRVSVCGVQMKTYSRFSRELKLTFTYFKAHCNRRNRLVGVDNEPLHWKNGSACARRQRGVCSLVEEADSISTQDGRGSRRRSGIFTVQTTVLYCSFGFGVPCLPLSSPASARSMEGRCRCSGLASLREIIDGREGRVGS